MKRLLVIALTMFSLICLSCCDDKDKVDDLTTECKCDNGVTCPDGGKEMCPKTEVADKNKCDPVCDAEKQDCICSEDKCECKDKDATCKCEDGTDCPEGDLAKCEGVAEDKCADKNAGDECDIDKVCSVGDDGKLLCSEKPATLTCEPTCDEATQDCVCEEDKCECKAKDAPAPLQPNKAE